VELLANQKSFGAKYNSQNDEKARYLSLEFWIFPMAKFPIANFFKGPKVPFFCDEKCPFCTS
jgi:hypothetical protein